MKNVGDQSRSITRKNKKKTQDGERCVRFDLSWVTVYIMPWNVSVGLKSDAPPLLCAMSSLPSRVIFLKWFVF